MFGRLILGIGWFALVVYLANAGVALSGVRGLTMQRAHLMGGLTATMLIAFTHTWLAIYLAGVKRMFRERSLLTEERSLSFGQRLATLVAGLALANFVVGVMRLGGSVQSWVHTGLVWLCLILQIVALMVEWRAVRSAVDGLEDLRAAVQGDREG